MAKESNLIERKKEYVINYKLKDFGGKVVFDFNMKKPLAFSYMFWKNRLFVTSRDDSNILLERSYHVFMEKTENNEQH